MRHAVHPPSASSKDHVRVGCHRMKTYGVLDDLLANMTETEAKTPQEAIQKARDIWLNSTTQSDLDQVERLYRWALSSKKNIETRSDIHDDDSEPPQKKTKKGHCGLDRSDYISASEKFALLLCQSGRCKKAKKGLASIGFTCRLAKRVLDYPEESKESSDESSSHTDHKRQKAPCTIVDNFLTLAELERLQSVFESTTASYWASHNYAVEPPSPYFSYVLSLEQIETDGFGFIGRLIQKVLHCPILTEKFPKLPNTRYIEMWAHNRPHASGHQLHFDSDDEGRGGVRNPIISTILYIADGDDEIAGGPSMVTNQKLSDEKLASKGWMSMPKPCRLVAFDGRYLHGVVPGKGAKHGRRVTLMFAFWDDIKIRRGLGQGSARPFPKNVLPTWASQLTKPMDTDTANTDNQYTNCKTAEPIELDRVYETLEGKAWNSREMPAYDEVFQGF
jgi:hypothetical protein